MNPARRRALALVAILSCALTAIASACSDDPLASAAKADSGAPPAVLGDSVCPGTPPDAGEGCVLPEGTTCSFGACGSALAECTRGAWRYSGNPPPRPPCPKDFPVEQSACPPCWPAGVECTYGSTDCSAPDASPNTTVASCVTSVDGQPQHWVLRTFVCGSSDASSPPEDGAAPSDAGADVQGDAEPDAD